MLSTTTEYTIERERMQLISEYPTDLLLLPLRT